jgi:hypothetical protein
MQKTNERTEQLLSEVMHALLPAYTSEPTELWELWEAMTRLAEHLGPPFSKVLSHYYVSWANDWKKEQPLVQEADHETLRRFQDFARNLHDVDPDSDGVDDWDAPLYWAWHRLEVFAKRLGPSCLEMVRGREFWALGDFSEHGEGDGAE